MLKPMMAALTLVIASPAHAFLEPPPQFNKPYVGGTTIAWFPRAEMKVKCEALAGRTLPVWPAECGKAKLHPKTRRMHCFVYINEIYRGTPTGELLFRHGRAHCHGWRHPIRQDHAL